VLRKIHIDTLPLQLVEQTSDPPQALASSVATKVPSQSKDEESRASAGPYEAAAPLNHPTLKMHPLSLRFVDTQQEREYTARQFQAAFLPLVVFLGGKMLICMGLAIGDSDGRIPYACVIFAFAAVLATRVWLHWHLNQQRACTLFGRALVVILVLTQLTVLMYRLYHDAPDCAEQSIGTFVCNRFMAMLALVYARFSATPIAHELVVYLSSATFFCLLPALTSLGRPAEPIFAFTALLLGESIGYTVETVLRCTFHEQQVYRQAQVHAEAQLERQALEAAAVEQKRSLEAAAVEQKQALEAMVVHQKLSIAKGGCDLYCVPTHTPDQIHTPASKTLTRCAWAHPNGCS
jgi:hypothetical protein